MKRMYIANHLFSSIEPLEVTSQTLFFVTYTNKSGKTEKRKISGQYTDICETWEAAKQCLLDRALRKLDSVKVSLWNAIKVKQEIESLPDAEPEQTNP
jgi:hypothetical protein